MLIFLYGQDDCRSLKKLREIVTQYQKKHPSGLNLKYFDCQKQSFANFKDQWQIRPMFGEKKLFVLSNLFANNDFKKDFLKQKESFLSSPNLILIHEREKIRKNDSFFIFLEKNAKTQKFEVLKGRSLEKWVGQEFSQAGIEIEETALNLLINSLDGNLWQMENEIKKLINYKLKTKKIRVADIKLLVRLETEPQIFKTIDLIAQKKKGEALLLLQNHLEKGDHPLFLLSMIAFEFKKLLIAKEHLERNRPVWTLNWQTKKALPLARAFRFEELKKIYQQIVRIDSEIKSGKINPELGLVLLVAKI